MDADRLPETLNGHLHKKRLVKIGHPAIIWHRAYFKQQGLDDDDWHTKIAEVFARTRRDANSTIEGWIKADSPGVETPKEHINDESELPEDINIIEPGESYSQKYKFKLSRGIVRITIGFEVYEEFWSRKLIIDYTEFHGKRSQYPLDPIEDRETFPIQDLGDILSFLTWDMNAEYQQALFEAQGCRLSPGPRIHPNTRTKPEPDNGAQMSDLSLAISRNLHTIQGKIFRALEKTDPQTGIACVDDKALRFADFIGHSFGLSLDQLPRRPEKWDLANTPLFFSKTPDQDIIRRVQSKLKFKRRHLDNVLRATQRIVEDVNPIVSNDSTKWPEDAQPISNDREYCLTLINRRRALYVSSLGGAGFPLGGGAEGKKPDYTQPLGYMVVCPHQAEWQIGRIIDTLHNIGMYRLASMHEYERLARVQNELRVLQDEAAQYGHQESQIEGLEERFTEQLRDPNAPVHSGETCDTKEERSDDGSDRSNAEPSPEADPTPLPLSPVAGGLRYRLDWCESYARTYWRLVDSLHFERIEGYQHYREFIQRNLSDNFENIAILRSRIDYLDSFIAKRFYTFNQTKLTGLQEDIHSVSIGAQRFTGLVTILTGVAAVPVMAKVLELVNNMIVVWMKGSSRIRFDFSTPFIGLLQYLASALLVTAVFRFFLYRRADEKTDPKTSPTPSVQTHRRQKQAVAWHRQSFIESARTRH